MSKDFNCNDTKLILNSHGGHSDPFGINLKLFCKQITGRELIFQKKVFYSNFN